MSISAGDRKDQKRGIVQELVADVVILVQQSIAEYSWDYTEDLSPASQVL